MKTIIRGFVLTTALALTGGLANAQSGPQCPPGTAPQTTTHQVCVGKGPASACYTYTKQNCQPLPPPPPSPGPRR
jgi:hypothetical protein